MAKEYIAQLKDLYSEYDESHDHYESFVCNLEFFEDKLYKIKIITDYDIHYKLVAVKPEGTRFEEMKKVHDCLNNIVKELHKLNKNITIEICANGGTSELELKVRHNENSDLPLSSKVQDNIMKYIYGDVFVFKSANSLKIDFSSFDNDDDDI
jgi:hypothetical protein